MTTQANTLKFPNATFFISKDGSEQAGRILRINKDDTIELAAGGALPVQAGGVLFRNETNGELSFYDTPTFNAKFDRLLGNGTVVSLTKSTAIQFLEIRGAEDAGHRADLAATTARSVLDEGKSFAQDLKNKAAASETGRQAIDMVNDVGAQSREFLKDASSQLDEALKSPTAERARAGLAELTGRLRKLSWGKVSKNG